MSLQALLFQKQAGNNGKLIGVFWDGGEMIRGVKKDKNGPFESHLCCSLLSRDEVNFTAYTSALCIKILLSSFFDARRTTSHFLKA